MEATKEPVTDAGMGSGHLSSPDPGFLLDTVRRSAYIGGMKNAATAAAEETPSEQARADASHPCDACGGIGYRETDVETFGTPHWGGTAYYPPCPVCQGSGRISDRMPVADAMADAETLRLEWERQSLGVIHHTDATRPVMTGALGDELLSAPLDWDRYAARAAFHAVPGLRGDR
jgi:hypothetical protein